MIRLWFLNMFSRMQKEILRLGVGRSGSNPIAGAEGVAERRLSSKGRPA